MSTDAPGEERGGTSGEARGFDRHMLEALVCPMTHSVLEYDAHAQELFSRRAGLAFPIRNGIPVMLIDEARKLD